MGTYKEGYVYPHLAIKEGSQLHRDLEAYAQARDLRLADVIRIILVDWSEAKHGVFSPFHGPSFPAFGAAYYPPQAGAPASQPTEEEDPEQQAQAAQEKQLLQTVSIWDD